MPMTVAAIHGRMGSIEFWQTKMRARELVAQARPASELDNWTHLSIEERIQRELNKRRVREEIVPYLAQAADRFFGSILVLVQNPKDFIFEPLSDVTSKIPAAYRPVVEAMGVLTIDGGQLVVLDGQHRLAALRTVIQGSDEKGKPVVGEYASAVPDDELVVVFVRLDVETTRNVFNKINKYAKPTSRSDNIITSTSDGYAIIARRLLQVGEPLSLTTDAGHLLVNWESNTLGATDPELTTISAVYATAKDLLAHHGIRFDEKKEVVGPAETKLAEAYDKVAEVWRSLLEDLAGFVNILDNRGSIATLRKSEDYAFGMLLRPAAHIVLFRALSRALDRGVSLKDAIARLNGLDWRFEADLWRGPLIAPNGRISAKEENYNKTAELLAYMISADRMTPEQIAAVETLVAD